MNELITFQPTNRFDTHRPVLADSTQVIAEQIHDHDILRPVLDTIQQLLDLRLILDGIR
jgi:hypothetical protein